MPILKKPRAVRAVPGKAEKVAHASQFPKTASQTLLRLEKGDESPGTPLRVGVLFSGGPAPGGHNVVWGLFESLKAYHPDSTLFGFLKGVDGLIQGKHEELKREKLLPFRNQGGFDLLGTGRTKFDTPEKFQAALKTAQALKLDGLVIIGGDDSHTNAAFLAEYLSDAKVSVIGVPKTIDGDLKNSHVAISFGFHTACSVYSELIGNLERDALSTRKYTHFVKLMGRSASHVTLECALRTHPNLALISEEKRTMDEIVADIADLIETRAKMGKNYGVILIPEGLVEFMPQEGLPQERDPHGHLLLSQIETEKLLIEKVRPKLREAKFNPLAHFFGYEGRCSMPSNFDATYTFALGSTAAQLIIAKATSLMCFIEGLKEPVSQWKAGGVPLVPLLHPGAKSLVIEKSLVDLKGAAYRTFQHERTRWRTNDAYLFPGPLQFFQKLEGDLPLSL